MDSPVASEAYEVLNALPGLLRQTQPDGERLVRPRLSSQPLGARRLGDDVLKRATGSQARLSTREAALMARDDIVARHPAMRPPKSCSLPARRSQTFARDASSVSLRSNRSRVGRKDRAGEFHGGDQLGRGGPWLAALDQPPAEGDHNRGEPGETTAGLSSSQRCGISSSTRNPIAS